MTRFLTPELNELEPYVPGEQPRSVKKLIKLNTNESPYPPCPDALKAASEQAPRARLYPDPTCRVLTAAIGAFYGIGQEHILCTNGSDEALAFLFRAFCPRGAVFADVTYGFYPVFADLFGIRCRTVPLREDFSVNVDDYAGAKETVFLANPNAPTGLCLPPRELRRLLEQDLDRLVVVDEAYIDFGGISAVPMLKEYDNLVVVQTFSKSRQLAGGRLAFAMASKELIEELGAVKFSFNPYSVNGLAMAMGTAAMLDLDYFEKTRHQIMADREITAHALKAMGFTVTDSKANFLFVSPPRISAEQYFHLLRDRGIIVRYWPGQERIKNYVRISIGSHEDMLALLEATKEIMEVS